MSPRVWGFPMSAFSSSPGRPPLLKATRPVVPLQGGSRVRTARRIPRGEQGPSESRNAAGTTRKSSERSQKPRPKIKIQIVFPQRVAINRFDRQASRAKANRSRAGLDRGRDARSLRTREMAASGPPGRQDLRRQDDRRRTLDRRRKPVQGEAVRVGAASSTSGNEDVSWESVDRAWAGAAGGAGAAPGVPRRTSSGKDWARLGSVASA